MRNYINRFAILIVSLILTQSAFADVKIKSKQTMSGQSTESTTYIKGSRQRAEQNAGGMQMVNITQCDLKRDLRIMPAAQTYMIDVWQAPSVAPTTQTKTSQTKTEQGGVVTVTYTTKDTGERKKMFGYTARHLIITMETESSPNACNRSKSKMEFDGWYIDATFALNCQNEQYQNYNNPQNQKAGCQDRYVSKQIGTAKRGYPLIEKTTMFDENGGESFSMTSEVVELSTVALDAALFDVPAGYREVKDSTALYASMSGGQSASNSSMQTNSSSNSAMSQNIKNAASSNANPNAASVGAKKAGVVRIGLAQVKTGAIGEGLNAAELAAAIQNTLSEYLKSPGVELVQLESKITSAIGEEARQKECDFVIYATVSHKKGGGGFGGMFGKALGQAIAQTGGGSWGNTTANVAGSVAAHTIVAASVAQNVKAKDEITLDVKVNAAGGAAQVLAKQYKQKAKGDGDDIITPIIEQAALAILDAVSK